MVVRVGKAAATVHRVKGAGSVPLLHALLLLWPEPRPSIAKLQNLLAVSRNLLAISRNIIITYVRKSPRKLILSYCIDSKQWRKKLKRDWEESH